MDVFVYGTLTDDATARAILDEYDYRGPAELVGLHRIDGRYPTLAPGGRTEGRILSTPDREALDEYEGVDRELYCRVSLPLDRPDADSAVECYIGTQRTDRVAGRGGVRGPRPPVLPGRGRRRQR
jgi:gamma-glutamylcyclotransferase (GGCT)/AIG2-like uncharacterized protein YtfP